MPGGPAVDAVWAARVSGWPDGWVARGRWVADGEGRCAAGAVVAAGGHGGCGLSKWRSPGFRGGCAARVALVAGALSHFAGAKVVLSGRTANFRADLLTGFNECA